MKAGAGPDVANVVARFFEWRCTGRRASIDQVLDAGGPVADRCGTRAAALSEIAIRARSERLGGNRSDMGGSVGSPGFAEFPELQGYDIIDCIGCGGMGVVYEAYQQSTGRRVAIKFMLETAAATETARRRFEREVELVARLDHPHIVSVLGSGVHRDRHFYVMDYIDGQSLDAAFPPGQCEERETLRLAQRVCEAVDYAHQRGVLHRDLKPSNILIDERGQPHVLDFGLAKAIDPESPGGLELTLSEPGQLIGTLSHMSPEQSRGAHEQMSVRSDVYSLGALTYEVLTGELPCSVDGPLGDVLERIARRDPVRPSLLRSKLSGDIDAILLKALRKAPRERYATAGELAADIRRHLNNEAVTARRQSRVYILRKTISRHRGWVTVGGLFLAALLVVAVAASMVAAQRQTVIAALEKQAQERAARLAAADARQAALTHYHQAMDLIRRKVRRADAMGLLDRALEIDPTLSAARHERAVLRGLHEAFARPVAKRSFLPTLRGLLSDFDRAHESAGGDWLVDPSTGRRLSPAEARALPTDQHNRLLAFPDVLRQTDGSLVRVEADGGHTPVGGPGFPRALVTAGNLLAAHLRQSPSGQRQDLLVAEMMDQYYERAAMLDPADVYTRLSNALAAAAKPARQTDAAQLLHALRDDAEATALAEFWQAMAEVHLGGPRRSFPEIHPARDLVAAEQAARQVTTLRPDEIYGWYLLGLALQGQGRYVEAIRANEQGWAAQQREDRRRAQDLDRFDGGPSLIAAPLLTNLATCHAMLGVFEPAWPLYEQALKQSDSPIVRLERAEAYHRAGMTQQAQADLAHLRDMLLRFGVPYPAAAVPVAWELLTFPDPEFRDPQAARNILERVRKRELWRNDPVALTLLSYALVQCGEAEAAFELASQLPTPSSPRPFQDAVLASVLHALGKAQQAREHLQRAESLDQLLAYPDIRLTRLLEHVRFLLAAE